MVGDVGYDVPHQTEATMDARNLHHDRLGVCYQREELRQGGKKRNFVKEAQVWAKFVG